MANHVEPMDVDDLETDFDNKENTYNSNVLPKGSCTEKGYEELDVSELNMKLRYSFTPSSSPMSKSYTSNCNATFSMDSLNNVNDNGNMTRSVGPLPLNDTTIKSTKPLGVRVITSDSSGNIRSPLGQSNLDRTLSDDINNITVTGNELNGGDDNISYPNSSTSSPSTPIATTPTKEIPKSTGSPIMRGLKSVLNMFRPSQSPIIAGDAGPDREEDINVPEIMSPIRDNVSTKQSDVVASTPIAYDKKGDNSGKRSSPLKDSIVFNDDLVGELQWNNDSTIIFSKEKIPIHKLFLPQITTESSSSSSDNFSIESNGQKSNDVSAEQNDNVSMEPMEISYNESIQRDRTLTEVNKLTELSETALLNETDKDNSVFHDCENSFNVQNESELLKSFVDTLDEKTSPNGNKMDNIENSDDTVTLVKDDTIEVITSNTEISNFGTDVKEQFKEINVTEIIENNVDSQAIETEEQLKNVKYDLGQNEDNQIPRNVNIVENFSNMEFNDCLKGPEVSLKNNIHLETCEITSNNDTVEEIVLSNNQVTEIIHNSETIPINDGLESIKTNNFLTVTNFDNVTEEYTGKNMIQKVENDEEKMLDNSLDVVKEIEITLENQVVQESEAAINNLSLPVKNTIENIIGSIDVGDKLLCEMQDTHCLNLDTNINMLEVSQKQSDVKMEILNECINTKVHKSTDDLNFLINTYAIETSTECGREILPETSTISPICNKEPILTMVNQSDNKMTDGIIINNKQIKEKTIPEVLEEEKVILNTSINTNSAQTEHFENEKVKILSTTIEVDIPNNEQEDIKNNHDNINLTETMDVVNEPIVEEVIVSENTSPYVSIHNENDSTKALDLESIENPFTTKTKIRLSPPNTPKDMNFDKIENPFATKSKVRMSPPPCEVSQKTEILFKEESESEETKNMILKTVVNNVNLDIITDDPKIEASYGQDNNSNTSIQNVCNEMFPISSDVQSNIDMRQETLKNNDYDTKMSDISIEKSVISEGIVNKIEGHNKVEIQEGQDNVISNHNNSSSEQYIYLSAGTSSGEEHQQKGIESLDFKDVLTKSILQLPKPDIESENPFQVKNKLRSSPDTTLLSIPDIESENPFQVKNKLRLSPDPTVVLPTPDIESENPFQVKNKLRLSPDTTVIFTDVGNSAESHNVKDNLINESLKIMEKTEEDNKINNLNDVTVEVEKTSVVDNISSESSKSSVNTEDEDTVEGPFLEDDHTTEVNDDDMEGPFLEEDPTTEVNDGDMKGPFLEENPTTEINDGDMELNPFTDANMHNDENFQPGEMFIDADAFDFLMNQNGNAIVDNGKESLFLKFDPLCASKGNAEGIESLLSKVQKRQSTPNKNISSIPPDFKEQPNLNLTFGDSVSEESSDDLNVTVSHKPTLAVVPAVSEATTSRNKSITPTRSNRQSLVVSSPAMAVIDRLLSLSANSPIMQNVGFTQRNREQPEAEEVLLQLRQLLAEKEQNVHQLRSESTKLRSRMAILETQMKVLESDNQDKLRRINDLNERLADKTQMNKNMATVVEEYERTIAGLIADTEQEKKQHAEERIKLIQERDEQTAHLASMEVSFSDLHSKYEKSKQIILVYKANEDTYKKSITEFEDSLKKMHNNYELLKQHATGKLNHANQELEKMNKAHESDVLKLNAMIKRKELHITSLEETLIQKTKANEELTAICDELINKVG